METVSHSENKLLRKTLAVIGATALLVSLAGCSKGDKNANRQSNAAVSLVPDMSGFLKPNTDDTCFNGGPRPCALLLRGKPQLSAAIINVAPTDETVNWPRERYRTSAGDPVEINCYVSNGQGISPYEGEGSSTTWYEVTVPSEHVANPNISHNAGQDVKGYASVEWFGQSVPDSRVPAC